MNNLPTPNKKRDGIPWVVKGVKFPNGTEFKTTYNSNEYYGKVENGALIINGRSHSTPSNAASSITKYNVNGWLFWKCRLPGHIDWIKIDELR